MPRIYTTTPPEIRFWRKVDKTGDCWLWLGCLDRRGYGQFGITRSDTTGAHRFAYRQVNGDIPAGLHVLHRCDNPRCVNPAHLWLGTNADNVRDRCAKGRTRAGRATLERRAKGETHGRVKLREADVLAIREASANGTENKALAERYCVSRAAITLIVKRKNWRHLT